MRVSLVLLSLVSLGRAGPTPPSGNWVDPTAPVHTAEENVTVYDSYGNLISVTIAPAIEELDASGSGLYVDGVDFSDLLTTTAPVIEEEIDASGSGLYVDGVDFTDLLTTTA